MELCFSDQLAVDLATVSSKRIKSFSDPHNQAIHLLLSQTTEFATPVRQTYSKEQSVPSFGASTAPIRIRELVLVLSLREWIYLDGLTIKKWVATSYKFLGHYVVAPSLHKVLHRTTPYRSESADTGEPHTYCCHQDEL